MVNKEAVQLVILSQLSTLTWELIVAHLHEGVKVHHLAEKLNFFVKHNLQYKH
jgi:hypothetical protein